MGQNLKDPKLFESSAYDVSTRQLYMQWMGDLGCDLRRAVFLHWPLNTRLGLSLLVWWMMQPRSRSSNAVPC